MKKLTYTEQLELEDQLPHKPEPADVFNMGLNQEEPLANYNYETDPKRPGTIVIPLSKKWYASLTDARARAEALFKHRGVFCYHTFQTARHFVFWCLPVDK